MNWRRTSDLQLTTTLQMWKKTMETSIRTVRTLEAMAKRRQLEPRLRVLLFPEAEEASMELRVTNEEELPIYGNGYSYTLQLRRLDDQLP